MIIQSPAKCWPGEIELPDALTFPQYIAWEIAVAAASAVTGGTLTLGEAAHNPAVSEAILPGVCACVTAWRLGGKWKPEYGTPKTFPSTPRAASAKMLFALIAAITRLVQEADEDLPKV